jgi:hypothetical protein
MPREIFPSSYQCDCGHRLNFFENTIREMKQARYRKRAGIGEGDNRHGVIFRKGRMVASYCPNVKAEISAAPEMDEEPSVSRRPSITCRQGQILEFIRLYTKLNHRPPSEHRIFKSRRRQHTA